MEFYMKMYRDRDFDPFKDFETLPLNPFMDHDDDLDIAPQSVFDSIDSIKYEELETVIVKAINLEEEAEVEVPAYNRQQVVVSELKTPDVEELGIENIAFPPVGAEFFTRKYENRVSWNVGRVRASKVLDVLAFGCREYDDQMDEGVVFQLQVRDGKRSYLWWNKKLKRVRSDTPLEVRSVDGLHLLNYTTDLSYDGIRAVPLRHTKFRNGLSYYVYVDGVPLYMPYDSLGVVKVVGGKAYSNDNVFVFGLLDRVEPGNYLANLREGFVIRRTIRRPDSSQQIQIIQTKVITTRSLLSMYPYLAGEGEIIDSAFVKIVKELDTTMDCCQILAVNPLEGDSRKKIFAASAGYESFHVMMASLSMKAVIIGNLRFFPYKGIYSLQKGRLKNKIYGRRRTRGELIVVKGLKPYHLNGTWYEYGDDLITYLGSQMEDEDRGTDEDYFDPASHVLKSCFTDV